MKNLLKDFWYLYFWTEIEGKKKYFLNYNRCRQYYHAQANISKSYYGVTVTGKVHCMHFVTTWDKRSMQEDVEACAKYYDKLSVGKGLGFVAEAEI